MVMQGYSDSEQTHHANRSNHVSHSSTAVEGVRSGGVTTTVAKVRSLLKEKDLRGVILSQEANVAWLFGGRYHINIAGESSIALVYISMEHVEVLVNNIEAERVVAEEGLYADNVHVHPWHDEVSRQAQLTKWLNLEQVVVDTALAAELRDIRALLDPVRVQAVRHFGYSLAEALEETCRAIRPGDREYRVAAKLASECYNRGIEPLVTLVGNETRSQQYRHLMPTASRIHEYAIVSVGGRLDGVVLSATRMIHFGPVPKQLMDKYNSISRVELAYLSASQSGTTLGQAFSRGVEQYEREGYAGEWEFHHQGGVAGYLSREIRAVSTSDWTLRPNVLMAWNPSIRGVKAEETALVTESGPDVLTRTEHFPLMTVNLNGFEMELPDILVL